MHTHTYTRTDTLTGAAINNTLLLRFAGVTARKLCAACAQQYFSSSSECACCAPSFGAIHFTAAAAAKPLLDNSSQFDFCLFTAAIRSQSPVAEELLSVITSGYTGSVWRCTTGTHRAVGQRVFLVNIPTIARANGRERNGRNTYYFD